MKKKYGFLSAFVFAIAIAIVVFAGVNFTTPTLAANAENTVNSEEQKTTIFDYVSITQENYVFSAKDFVSTVINSVEYDALFTNKTVTIALNYSFSSVYDSFDITINSNTLEEDDEHIIEINGKKYYVFDVEKLTEDTATRVYLSISLYNPPTQTKPQATYTTYSLSFMLIQTKNNFTTNQDILWEYTYNTVLETISAPSTDYTYPPLKLTVPNGTKLNPVYVKFNYLGETYEIYNVDGVFYNAKNDYALDFTTIDFNLSGTYSVEIYDKTRYANYQNRNYLSYNFIVKNTTTKLDAFYIHAHLENGDLVMNNQISNYATIVDFVNLSDITTLVDKIVVVKSYRPSGGENISETVEYGRTSLPSSLTFDEDGTYNIKVIGRNNGNIIKEFEFILIESIRSYFEIDGTRYEIPSNGASNTTKTFNITRSIISNYNDIEGDSEYSFYVIIARSEPSIDGVTNNARTSDSVSVVVRGVGTIDVSITQDGKTYTKEYKNGERLPTFSDPGKYFIKITDEMGTTVTKSFTINIKMNTAAIILIALAAVTVVVLIVLIFISRTRVKVR